MALAFRRFKESAAIGAMGKVRGLLLARARVLVARARVLVASAHIVARRVRVNVAVGELHIAAADGEAAALTEE